MVSSWKDIYRAIWEHSKSQAWPQRISSLKAKHYCYRRKSTKIKFKSPQIWNTVQSKRFCEALSNSKNYEESLEWGKLT
ncbi:hypothetical protein S245_001378 [Arachis hypogaea]